MLHSLSKNIAVFLFDNNDRFPLDVYTYGIEICLSSLIGIMLILSIGLISGYFLEGLFYIITLFAIRSYTGGYHADTYFKCNLIYVFSYLFAIGLNIFFSSLNSAFRIFIYLIIVITSIIVVCVFAPIENKNKTIDENSKNKFKIISIIAIILVSVTSLLLSYLLHFYQVLIVFPSVFVVEISVLVEIILLKRRRVKNEKIKENGKENC